jgi:hypothetical protein
MTSARKNCFCEPGMTEVDDRVVNQNDSAQVSLAEALKHTLEAAKLDLAEVTGSLKERRRLGAAEAHEGGIAAHAHDGVVREARCGQAWSPCPVRVHELRPEIPGLGGRHANVRIVVAGNERDPIGLAQSPQLRCRLDEFLLERDMGEIPGDRDVVRPLLAQIPNNALEHLCMVAMPPPCAPRDPTGQPLPEQVELSGAFKCRCVPVR